MLDPLAPLLGGGMSEPLPLPLTRLDAPTVFDVILNYPPLKALLPIPILAALAPLVIWFFRKTWQQLDAEARADWSQRDEPRKATGPSAALAPPPTPRRWQRRIDRAFYTGPHASRPPRIQRLGRTRPPTRPLVSPVPPPSPALAPYDFRPALCLLIVAIVLTLQEYYGGRRFYQDLIRPALLELEASGHTWPAMARYDELWSYTWWTGARLVGYVLIPYPLWKLFYPRDSLLDMGLRLRGFTSHLWIYGLCLAFVLPSMLIVASQPDFGTYYPFYKLSSRSWFDFLVWEAMYWLQFLALEMFFRGWMLGAMRKSIGAAAIFVMAVPYCMIHYGKPYLEANGAIVAGIVLGSLAMHTRSIYAGFLVHITVAFLMDFLSLWKNDALPTQWFPG